MFINSISVPNEGHYALIGKVNIVMLSVHRLVGFGPDIMFFVPGLHVGMTGKIPATWSTVYHTSGGISLTNVWIVLEVYSLWRLCLTSPTRCRFSMDFPWMRHTWEAK